MIQKLALGDIRAPPPVPHLSETLGEGHQRTEDGMQVGCDISGRCVWEHHHMSRANMYGGRLDPEITAGGHSCPSPPRPTYE